MFSFILGALIGAAIVIWFKIGVKPEPPPRHGEELRRQHYRGQLRGDKKFVYCPVGHIVSWSPGDYDNKWCHWCKIYYEPI